MVKYEQDTYGWSLETAAALRERRLDAVDLDAVAEEILDVGRHERRILRSALMQVLIHLLKGMYQPEKQSRSWNLSIVEHRERATIALRHNPSLRPLLPDVMAEAYSLARVRAARQTKLPLSRFPETCPFSVSEVAGE